MDLIQVVSYSPFIEVIPNNIYGGKRFEVSLTKDAIEVIEWAKSYKAQVELEDMLRKNNEMIKSLYDQYKIAIELIK